jgi:hypothetical protein
MRHTVPSLSATVVAKWAQSAIATGVRCVGAVSTTLCICAGHVVGKRYGVTCIKPITCRKRFIADHALRVAGCLLRRWRGTSTTARHAVVSAGSLSLRQRRQTAEAPGGACGPGASPGACCNDAARALLVKVDFATVQKIRSSLAEWHIGSLGSES